MRNRRKVYANDTFCLYLGLMIALVGFFFVVLLSPFATYSDMAVKMGFALIGLGISIQLMAFQSGTER